MTQSNPSPNHKEHSESSKNTLLSLVYLDLVLILIITATAIVIVFAPSESVIIPRAVVGLLLILFAPGYTLLAAVFPHKESITNVERGIFSLVFSMIIVGGVGLLLSYAKSGLSSASLVVSIAVFVVVGTCAAFVRRRSLSPGQSFVIFVPRVSDVRRALSLPKVTGTLDKTLVVVLMLIVVTSLVATVYLVATPFSSQPYTELYILGKDGKAQDYPSQFRLGEGQSMIVGITNHEQRIVEYRLVTTLNGTTGSSTLSTEKFSLENNQNWEQTVAISPDQTGTNLKLSFLLYANNDTSPLQTTHLWMNVTA